MSSRLDRVVSFAIIFCALAVGGSVLYRTFSGGGSGRNEKAADPERVANWDELVARSLPVRGDPSARVVVVEFADLECPACRVLHEQLGDVMDAIPGGLHLRYVPFPLPMHRFAKPAASAAECAAEIGMLGPWMDAVYGAQDSLGLKSWAAYATSAGIADSMRITECATAAVHPRVVAGGGFRVGPWSESDAHPFCQRLPTPQLHVGYRAA